MDFELFSSNVRGMTRTSKLKGLLKIAIKHKISNKYVIMLQETKLNCLKEEHRKIISFHKMKFEFVPADATSGGHIFLLEHLKDDFIALCKTNSCLAIYNPEMQLYLLNVYVNPKDTNGSHLQKSIEDVNIDRSQKIIIPGDLNSIDIDDHVSNPPKSNDIRVLRHQKLNSFFLNFC